MEVVAVPVLTDTLPHGLDTVPDDLRHRVA